MKLSTPLATLLLLPFINLPQQARAEFVVFDFHGATGDHLDPDELTSSGTSTVMGITLTASTGDPSDVFNRTSSHFGINSDGTGDETDRFDLRAGTTTPEMMTFSFAPVSGSAMITLESLKFDLFTDGDMGRLAHLGGGFATINFGDSDLDSSNVLAVQQSIEAGDNLRLSYVSGNGFGLQNITLNVTAVPEPSLAAALNLLFASVLLQRTRRRRAGA